MLGVEYDRTGVNRSALSSCMVQESQQRKGQRALASERHGAFGVLMDERMNAITEELF